eukprot:1196969-Amphidinium_carterae.2
MLKVVLRLGNVVREYEAETEYAVPDFIKCVAHEDKKERQGWLGKLKAKGKDKSAQNSKDKNM